MNQWTILTLFLVSIVFVVLILSQSLLKKRRRHPLLLVVLILSSEIRYESVDNSYFISRLYCVSCPDLVAITAQKRRRHPLMMRDKIWISGQLDVSIVFVVLILSQTLLKRDADTLFLYWCYCVLSWSCLYFTAQKRRRHPLMIKR